MKLLCLLMLMSSAFSLSLVSASSNRTPSSSGIGQLWNDFTEYITCGVSRFVHRFFAVEDPYVNFWHFSQKNKDKGCDLQPTAEALKKCQFNPKLETKVLVHGWISKFPLGNLNFYMKDMFLQSGDYNIVIYNWTSYNQNENMSVIDYPVSAFRTFKIGLKLSSWIGFLQDNTGVDPNSFHVIGHSLGSEVSAIAGKTTCTLGRITFLDPAAVIFRYLPSFLKPASTDALYTEAIHTDAASNAIQGYGYMEPVAHVDFYPNGGNNQPKCRSGEEFLYMTGEVGTVHSSGTDISCNHYSALDYFMSSFNTSCHFDGFVCPDYNSFQRGKCNYKNSPRCRMGIYARMQQNLPIHSKCYFRTSATPPYCIP